MTDSSQERVFRELVLEWQRPLYNLAFRMLGNEPDAADATQEVFARVFRKIHLYDRNRPFRAWIFRVATNVVFNLNRKRKLRRIKERQLAQGRTPWEEDDPAEKREMEAVVQEHLAKVPREARSLLVLHYFNGLSKVEVAQILGVPRTTVESRMKKALAAMRRQLRGAGHLSVLPVLEQTMRNAPVLEVQGGLTSSLVTMASQAAASPVTAGMALGGYLMTKKLLVGALLLTLLSLSVGYLVGETRADTRDRAVGAGGEQRDVARLRELDRLKRDNQRLAEELTALKTLQAEREAAEAEAAAQETPAVAPRSASGIDWVQFAKTFAQNIDALDRMVGANRVDRSELSQAEQARVYEVATLLMRIAEKAKGLSPAPFFDAAIFPELIDSMYGPSMGMTESQRADLVRLSRSVLLDNTNGFDAAGALPVERFRVRLAMIRAFEEAMGKRISESDKAQWGKVHGTAVEVLEGSVREVRVRVKPDGDRESYTDIVMQYWSDAYAMTPEQRKTTRAAARALVERAQNVLQRRGLLAEDTVPKDAAEASALRQEILRLQAEAERSFQHVLTEEQRKKARRARPTAFTFSYGVGYSSSGRNRPGF